MRRLVVPGLADPPGYAHVAVAGPLVVTAGAVPLDADGNVVGADHAAQAAQVLANLEAQLAAVGAGPADVLKTTVYVVVAAERAPLGEVWEVVRASRFAGAASTLLGVSALGYPGQLVEIEAIAALE